MQLRTARLKARLTQVELAERSGVAQNVISQIETGKVSDPAWRTVGRLSAALRVRPERLFPLDGGRKVA